MALDILQRDKENIQRRPDVLGNAVEYVYIPARGFMSGRLVKEGQALRIITLEGKQVADTIIWDANRLENVFNCSMTMILNRRWNYWQLGDVLYSKDCDKLASFGEDSSGGIHAAFGAFCNEAYWRKMSGISGCPNCRDNLVAAMAGYGFSSKDLDWGSCISLFMNLVYEPDGTIGRGDSVNKPGDYVDIIAQMDIIVAISNCPGERSATASKPTPVQVVIFEPQPEYKDKVMKIANQ
jgi:hypothetical protein